MKKLVLRRLPPEIERSIKRKALNEDISREDAVIAILRDAEIERQVKHELAILERNLEEGEPGEP